MSLVKELCEEKCTDTELKNRVLAHASLRSAPALVRDFLAGILDLSMLVAVYALPRGPGALLPRGATGRLLHHTKLALFSRCYYWAVCPRQRQFIFVHEDGSGDWAWRTYGSDLTLTGTDSSDEEHASHIFPVADALTGIPLVCCEPEGDKHTQLAVSDDELRRVSLPLVTDERLGTDNVALDQERGRLYVHDSASGITVWQLSKNGIATSGQEQSVVQLANAYRLCTAIALDPIGQVLYAVDNTCDAKTFILRAYDTETGAHIRYLTYAKDPQIQPCGLAVDGHGLLYVADRRDQILVFSSDGTLVRKWFCSRPLAVRVDWAGRVCVLSGSFGKPVSLNIYT